MVCVNLATRVHEHTHSQFKWFCQLDNRGGGSEQRTGKKVEKQSKLDCLFPRSASDSSVWVTVPLSFSLSSSFSLCLCLSRSLWLPFCRRRKEKLGGKEEEEEASFHGDGWWKRTRQVLLGCTPLLYLSLLPPFSQSVPTQTAKPPPRKHLSVHVSNLLTAPPSLYLVFSHIHKTLIHPIPVFPLICYRFHTWLFQDSLHAASKHYTHMLLLCLILNPGPLMCCHNSFCSSVKTFLEILEPGLNPFRGCCSAALKQTAAMRLETPCGLKLLPGCPMAANCFTEWMG